MAFITVSNFLALGPRLPTVVLTAPIWRRVMVPACFDLAKRHRVIQEPSGWEDF
jgi:hypothetical protein